MNRHIPLDIFLPPVQDFGDVNMLVSKDKYGLNEGSFLIRVNPWSVRLLSAVIAFHSLKPEVEFENSEQSAVEETMEGLIEDVLPTDASQSVLHCADVITRIPGNHRWFTSLNIGLIHTRIKMQETRHPRTNMSTHWEGCRYTSNQTEMACG